MSRPKIEIELDGMPSSRASFPAEEAKIRCNHPNFHQLTVETGGATEVVIDHSGVEVAIGRATDSTDLRVTIIDADGRVQSFEFNPAPAR